MAERAASLLPADVPALRLVPARLVHLTLAFLGSVPPGRRPEAGDALRAAARSSGPFDVRLDRLGRFPERGPPAVLWLAAGRGAVELAVLAERVRLALGERGIPFDAKPFRTHVTLARVRRGTPPAEAVAFDDVLRQTLVPPLDFRADSIHLVESVLSRQGARYVWSEETALSGAGSE